MQMIAAGKWSKTDERWNLVLALRRRTVSASGLPATAPDERKKPLQKGTRQRPRRRGTASAKLVR